MPEQRYEVLVRSLVAGTRSAKVGEGRGFGSTGLILGLAIGLSGVWIYARSPSQVGEGRFMGLFLIVLGLVVSSLRYH